MQTVDAFLCCDPPSACRIFEPFNRSVIIVATTRYNIERSKTARWEAWNARLTALAAQPWNVVAAADNRFDARVHSLPVLHRRRRLAATKHVRLCNTQRCLQPDSARLFALNAGPRRGVRTILPHRVAQDGCHPRLNADSSAPPVPVVPVLRLGRTSRHSPFTLPGVHNGRARAVPAEHSAVHPGAQTAHALAPRTLRSART